MKRLELLAALKQAEPALSSRDLIPCFACYLFRNGTVEGYNDVVAIRSACDTGITGGVNGKTLLSWLSASHAKDVSFKQDDDTLTVKAGRARLRQPFYQQDDFVFDWPKVKKSDLITLPMDEAFLNALRSAAISASEDQNHPWRLGVTLVAEGKWAAFYSSDAYSLTRSTFDLAESIHKQHREVLLPPKFVDLVLTAGEGGTLLFTYGEEWVMARYEGTDIFSKTPQEVDGKRYKKTLDGSIKDTHKAVDLPSGLQPALSRAVVVAGSKSHDEFTTFKVADGRLRLSTCTVRGDAKDVMRLAHKDVSVHCDAQFLLRALPHAAEVSFNQRCIVLKGEGFEHLISTAVT
jgi:DNA polymerase III sliding clamp (beta) subunit (PCNA family)